MSQHISISPSYDEAVEAALNLRHAVDRLANDQD